MKEQSNPGREAPDLPLGIRVATAWSWRLLVIGVAIAALLWLIVQVHFLVVPLLIAMLLTALLQPIVMGFVKRGMPRWIGVITALLTLIVSVSVLVFLIITQVRTGLGDIEERSILAWKDFLKWVETGPLGLPAENIDGLLNEAVKTLQSHQSDIWSGALALTTTAGQLVAGTLLMLFSLIFLLIDGKRIWFWVLGFLPKNAHAPVNTAGIAGWHSVGKYVRVQILVAFVDAVGIGLGAFLLGVPLVIPIAILVFLGSFIPFMGAFITGGLAAFVALVYNGPVNALIMVGVVLLVNQIEGHVLQPLVMGNAVRVHPLGVVLAVSAGALLAGIPGALFAVPIAASASAIVNTLVQKQWDPKSDPVAEFLKKDETHRTAVRRLKFSRKGNA